MQSLDDALETTGNMIREAYDETAISISSVYGIFVIRQIRANTCDLSFRQWRSGGLAVADSDGIIGDFKMPGPIRWRRD